MVRWNSQGVEGSTLLSLFEENTKNKNTGADPKIQDCLYIHDNIWDKHEVFKQWKPKNFYTTYRRLAREFLLNKGIVDKQSN